MDKEFSNIKERILHFTDIKGFTKERFFEGLGVTYGNFKGAAKDKALGSDIIARIVTKYPEINPIWLLTGEGEIFIEDNSKSVSKNKGGSKNQISSINGNNGTVTISHNDFEDLQELQKELNERLRTCQEQLSESQKQISALLVQVTTLLGMVNEGEQ